MNKEYPRMTADDITMMAFLKDAMKHETALNLLINSALICQHYEVCARLRDVRNKRFKPTKDKKKLQDLEHFLNMQIKDCRNFMEKNPDNHLTIHLNERNIILYEHILEFLKNKR